MQTVRQLDKAIDSLDRYPDSFARRSKRELKELIPALAQVDSTGSSTAARVKSFDDLIPDSLKSLINERALNTVSSLKNTSLVTSNDFLLRSNDLTLHLMEWHKKFSLSVACLVLFFIGAPLGSIIRKGGLGMPLVVAIIFFLIFHLFNMFGEKFVRQGLLNPLGGTWLPVFALSPVGIFLTYKASMDSQLFSKEYYYRFFKKMVAYVDVFLSKFRGRN